MVIENEGNPRKVAVTVWLLPEEHAAAEQTARRHGATLPDALGCWALFLAVATWLPGGSEAKWVRRWFAQIFPPKEEPPCR